LTWMMGAPIILAMSAVHDSRISRSSREKELGGKTYRRRETSGRLKRRWCSRCCWAAHGVSHQGGINRQHTERALTC
jgi:hypothetical protein